MRKIEKRILAAINNGTDLTVSYRPYNGSRRRGPSEPHDRVEHWPSLGVTRVYLINTCIARIYADRVQIDTGGHRTVTTKSRLNAILREYCDSYIVQRDWAWYLESRVYEDWYSEDNDYEDGMSIPRGR